MVMTRDDIFIHLYSRYYDKLVNSDLKIYNDYEIIDKQNIPSFEYLELSIIFEDKKIQNIKKYSVLKEHVLLFDSFSYIHNILRSYKYNSEKIIDQFQQDFHRSDIYLNNEKIMDMKVLKKKIKKLQKFGNKFEEFNLTSDKLLIMLMNQSTFAFPFILMSEIFNDEENKIFVFNMPNERKTFLNLNKINEIIFTMMFQVIDTNSNKILLKISITLILSLNIVMQKNKYKIFNDNFIFSKFGIITWSIIE
ncbi:Hypothetical protein KVN_LOCUS443 [uncultured virus]|nr:Hypothetical protein KVN_LOCUS443 [uncultured virus]